MPPIPTIHEPVPTPQTPADPHRLAHLPLALSERGYTLATCAQRLGVFPRLGVNFWPAMRNRWTPNPDDPVDTLLELFIDGRDIPADRIRSQFGAAFLDTLIETRLAEQHGAALQSKLCLFPCYGKYIATDRAQKNTAINQVMWLWGESFLLGGLVNRNPRRRAIDLGTGSGVHAILAADHCQSVIAVDINPRALDFARFNAALNGAHNIDFVQSDLLNSVEGSFDLLVANPPYLPDAAARPGDNFWSGGPQGTELLGRIIQALPTRLDAEGTAHVVALYPCQPGTQIQDLFAPWLGGHLGNYEVLDHTWPVPHFQDLLSAQPYQGDKSAWRFGVISLRLAEKGSGWWKEPGGAGMFFREDGSPAVMAGYDIAPSIECD